MNKNIAISVFLGFSLLAAGCSQSQVEPPEAPRSAPNTLGLSHPTAPAGGMGKTAAEQQGVDKSYFFDAGAQGGSPAAAAAPSDYVNEKQSVNYLVSERKPKKITVKGKENDREVADEELSKFKVAIQQPISTFSADVDTASYSNMRRAIMEGHVPDRELVRVEEMINYFNYDLAEPEADEPFSLTTELSSCPWSEDSEILRVSVKTKSLERGQSPPQNLVFLLDVSGSMNAPDKLPLLKKSLRQMVDTLDDNDRVAIVVYAGASGVVLPSTTGDKKTTILEAIERLNAGGGTNGESGIRLAYNVAQESMTEDSVNRVILATDGDFNVGLSSDSELKSFIEEKRESGLFLSVLGFGRSGNDRLMETLADNGNGNYASIDNLHEARKVLVREAGATLVTVAKDVKFQVVFNTEEVESYRLIGYKNRRLATRDFDDDTKDAGELGAGHEVTALYEIRPKGGLDRTLLEKSGLDSGKKLAALKMRYKAPDSDTSTLMEHDVVHRSEEISESSTDHQWAIAVAGYGMLLEGELSTDELPFQRIWKLLSPTMADDPDAYQSEFYSLTKKAQELMATE